MKVYVTKRYHNNRLRIYCGYKNLQDSIRNHINSKYIRKYEEFKGVSDSLTPLNMQPHTIFINEPGLYSLIMRSKLPQAIEFQKWVYAVIQSIRKHGEYKIRKELENKVF